MINKFKSLLVILVISLIVMLTGCGKNLNEGAKDKEEKNDKFPVTVVNYDNNEVTLKEKPKKVSSLTLGMDEMLLEMVSEDRVVGLSGKSADNEAVSNVASKASKFPKIENNIEILLAQKPDLVIGASWVKAEFLKQLKDNNITYYGYKTPTTIEEQKQIILDLAKILGEDEKGQDIVNDMNTRIGVVKEEIKKSSAKNVKVMAYNMHGSTNGDKTIFNDIVKEIGAVNVSTEAGLQGVSKISKEKIIELNPEVIILMAWEKDDLKEFENFASSLKNDKSLGNVEAIKNNRVYIASNRYMTSVSHHIIDGVEFMAKSVYPDVYKK